ncbi:Inositol-tetrakisphosphate 1-kinase [Clonorchis sinensis]|uniref:Inositol-tetrakisphosphate 1-kinase n=2 Tax=Clonorchis sinensis TaxID=79923 RepID=A0A8T1MFR3_CLOSI|nr:Inositol-tetrakisphosphate 1-kinase [Clonorchis sinensis]
MKVVGIIMGNEKGRKMNLDAFLTAHHSPSLRFVKLQSIDDLESIEIDAIIQKIPELLTCQLSSDDDCAKRFDAFLKGNPNVICIDPPNNVRLLLWRHEQFLLIENAVKSSDLADRICVPPFCTLDSKDPAINLKRILAVSLKFPLICKPLSSHGDERAHSMALLFNKEGLEQISYPTLVQQFWNHDGALFKVAVVGDKTFVVMRPSIKNLQIADDRKPLFFNSHTASKFNRDGPLGDLKNDKDLDRFQTFCDDPLFVKVAALLRRTVGIDLFGFDVIRLTKDESSVERTGPEWAIVDLNYFPSYDKIPHFYHHLENLVREKLSLPLLPDPSSEDC